MPMGKFKPGDEPKPKRKKKRVLGDTEEWQGIKAKLSAGLSPGEKSHWFFTQEQVDSYGMTMVNAMRNLKKMTMDYVKGLQLHYDVRYYLSDNDIRWLEISNPIQLYHAGATKAVPADEREKPSKRKKH